MVLVADDCRHWNLGAFCSLNCLEGYNGNEHDDGWEVFVDDGQEESST